MNSPKSRSHKNASQRVFRIIHTHGEQAGRTTEVNGRAFGAGLKTGRLVAISERLARVAVGFLAHYDAAKKALWFIVFAPMVLNWEIIEKVTSRGPFQSLTETERDFRMRNGKPLVDEKPAIVIEKRRRIGKVEFVKEFGIGTQPAIY